MIAGAFALLAAAFVSEVVAAAGVLPLASAEVLGAVVVALLFVFFGCFAL